MSVVEPTPWPPLAENDTLSPLRRLPFASLTVAVAFDVDEPSAVTELGFKLTLTFAAVPGVCVNVAELDTAPSLAVIFD